MPPLDQSQTASTIVSPSLDKTVLRFRKFSLERIAEEVEAAAICAGTDFDSLARMHMQRFRECMIGHQSYGRKFLWALNFALGILTCPWEAQRRPAAEDTHACAVCTDASVQRHRRLECRWIKSVPSGPPSRRASSPATQ